MNLSTSHIQRYKQIAKLLWKYGRSDLVKQMQIIDALDEADRLGEQGEIDSRLPEQIAEDFEVLAQLASMLEQHSTFGKRNRLNEIVEEFRLSIQQELNYEMEARNLTMLGKNLEEFDLIYVPQPINDYCSRRVLTME